MAFYTPVFTNKLKGHNNNMQPNAEIDALFEKAAKSAGDISADNALLEDIRKKVTTKDCVSLAPNGMTPSLINAQEKCQKAEKDLTYTLSSPVKTSLR